MKPIRPLLEPITHAIATVFFCMCAANAWAQEPPVPLKEGSRIYVERHISAFPNLQLHDAQGHMQHLSDYHGKVVLVNMWATWCTPCIRELPALNALQQRLPDALTIITLSQDRGGFATITPFVQQHDAHALTHRWDKGGREFRKLRVKGLPMSFLLDPQGRLIATIQGETDWLDEDFIALIHQHIGNHP